MLTDVTSTSEDAKMALTLMTNGTETPSLSPQLELNSAGNLTITGALNTTQVNIDSVATINTDTLTTTSTAIVSLQTTTRNAMSGFINIIQGANVHCLNYTALRVDATTAMITTYGEMYNNISLASFTADVSAGVLRLRVTPTSATSTVFNAVRTSLD
jgi:hypothetical protein